MAEIIIVDEFVEKKGQFLDNRSENLFNCIEKYCSILESIRKEGIMEGETAEALDTFVLQVRMIQGLTKNCKPGTRAVQYCENYLSRIEDADEDLYNA